MNLLSILVVFLEEVTSRGKKKLTWNNFCIDLQAAFLVQREDAVDNAEKKDLTPVRTLLHLSLKFQVFESISEFEAVLCHYTKRNI